MFSLDEGPDMEEGYEMLWGGEDLGLFQWLWGYDAAESGREAWKRLANETHENEIKA